MGSHYVAQARLELLGSSNLPALAPKVLGLQGRTTMPKLYSFFIFRPLSFPPDNTIQHLIQRKTKIYQLQTKHSICKKNQSEHQIFYSTQSTGLKNKTKHYFLKTITAMQIQLLTIVTVYVILNLHCCIIRTFKYLKFLTKFYMLILKILNTIV